jgi:biotin transport system substrate-specific component
MTSILAPSARGFDPLGIAGRSLPMQAALLLFGTGVLALASQISVPMVPVPITLQTFALTMIGVLYGWRLGALTVLAWLGEAMVGLPVLANGGGGLAPFVGPTAGYLVSFPIIAALAGYLAEKGCRSSRPLQATLPKRAGRVSAWSKALSRISLPTSCAS